MELKRTDIEKRKNKTRENTKGGCRLKFEKNKFYYDKELNEIRKIKEYKNKRERKIKIKFFYKEEGNPNVSKYTIKLIEGEFFKMIDDDENEIKVLLEKKL